MRIIGLVGRRGIGKNFVADRIEEKVVRGRTEKAALADPIKRFAIDVLGLDEELVYGNDLDKASATKYRWDSIPEYLFGGPIRQKLVCANNEKRKCLTIRDILQVIGTELGRDIWGNDIWIKAMENRVKKSRAKVFVITDVRFPNEAEAVRKWGGEIWRIEGTQRGDSKAAKDTHPSETSADEIVADFTVRNATDDNKATVRNQVGKLLRK
jgi:hypothetical protein